MLTTFVGCHQLQHYPTGKGLECGELQEESVIYHPRIETKNLSIVGQMQHP